MKRKVVFFLGVLFLVIVFFILQKMDKDLGSLIEISKSNVKNIKKVKVGINVDSLNTIMGKPERIQLLENQNKSYFYIHLMDDGEYESIRVYVDSTQVVYDIFNPREFYNLPNPQHRKE